ncbi:hypothetical protein QBC36DRAFT_45961 [Triangularia setosa]|uniref:Uncharacterized protein n=1 Tax=Triangularia setosa TaxID=2587417 RepID=A0AAN6W348_9PEZI|nr:hypothetical protein QBC36DRAFT_45961 [Podospora setosa]
MSHLIAPIPTRQHIHQVHLSTRLLPPPSHPPHEHNVTWPNEGHPELKSPKRIGFLPTNHPQNLIWTTRIYTIPQTYRTCLASSKKRKHLLVGTVCLEQNVRLPADMPPPMPDATRARDVRWAAKEAAENETHDTNTTNLPPRMFVVVFRKKEDTDAARKRRGSTCAFFFFSFHSFRAFYESFTSMVSTFFFLFGVVDFQIHHQQSEQKWNIFVNVIVLLLWLTESILPFIPA